MVVFMCLTQLLGLNHSLKLFGDKQINMEYLECVLLLRWIELADFYRCVDMIVERLGATPGSSASTRSESNFKGVIDLILIKQ